MLLCTLCASRFKTGNLELTERWINLWLPSWLSLENMALKFAWQRVTETCNSQSVSSWWTLPISCSVSSAPWQYLIQLALCWLRWDGFQLHLRNHESNSSLPGPQQGSRQRHWNHLKQNPVKSLFPKWKIGKQQQQSLWNLMFSFQEASKYLCLSNKEKSNHVPLSDPHFCFLPATSLISGCFLCNYSRRTGLSVGWFLHWKYTLCTWKSLTPLPSKVFWFLEDLQLGHGIGIIVIHLETERLIK